MRERKCCCPEAGEKGSRRGQQCTEHVDYAVDVDVELAVSRRGTLRRSAGVARERFPFWDLRGRVDGQLRPQRSTSPLRRPEQRWPLHEAFAID